MATDPDAPKHNLPACTHVPIAAADVESIERHVGSVVESRIGRDGRINAVLIKSHDAGFPKSPVAPLWKTTEAEAYAQRLFPELQVWVHVDYRAYRRAYLRFGMPEIPEGHFLDHIQNRRSTRIRWYSHPYLRLCPVSRLVNTSAGHRTGGEGMEVEYLLSLEKNPEALQRVKA